MKTQRGFTLLELIVAISILAIVAVLSWRGLDAVLHTRDSLNDAQARNDALQRSFNRIERDALLAQTVELFEGGRVRLWAGNQTTVEYQLLDTNLTRRVLGPDDVVQEQQILVSDLASLQAEIYQPGAAGNGVWSATPTNNVRAHEGTGMMAAQPVGPPVPVAETGPETTAADTGNAAPVAASAKAVPASINPAAGNGGGNNGANNSRNNGGNNSGNNGTTPTGLRLRLNTHNGGVIERIFLLGASS